MVFYIASHISVVPYFISIFRVYGDFLLGDIIVPRVRYTNRLLSVAYFRCRYFV